MKYYSPKFSLTVALPPWAHVRPTSRRYGDWHPQSSGLWRQEMRASRRNVRAGRHFVFARIEAKHAKARYRYYTFKFSWCAGMKDGFGLVTVGGHQ